MKIVFATGNAHKLQEIQEIAGDAVDFVLPPEGFDPVEDGETFEENSLIKAREAARLSGMMSLADDSGLCVEALNGAPGIHSARYAETAQARIDKLLDELRHCEPRTRYLRNGRSNPAYSDNQILKHKGQSDVQNDKPNRRAKFVCAMTLVDADGKVLFQTRGECHGEIAREQSGANGFGYDPIFLVEPSPSLLLPMRGKKVTMAEMSEEEKNKISHRGIALRKVLEYLNSTFPLPREGK